MASNHGDTQMKIDNPDAMVVDLCGLGSLCDATFLAIGPKKRTYNPNNG